MSKVRLIHLSALLVFLTAISACSFAPIYQRPLMSLPMQYKESDAWKPAQSTASLGREEFWWELFKDPVLNDLEQRVKCGNQDLKAAFFRYRQSVAIVQIERSAYYPTITGIANANRQKTSSTVANPNNTIHFSDLLVGSRLNYELDLWGRIQNSVEASESSAKASSSDLAALVLSMHAQLAIDYFALRGNEEAQLILDKTVLAYQKALSLTKERYIGGAAPIADVDQAEAQLETAKTKAADMRLEHAKLEHAIAELIGEIPANFKMPKTRVKQILVNLAPELPSTLLERRPDIAAAEERVKAANSEIGVACAAFFPTIDLSTLAGLESNSLAQLISAPSAFWSIGSVNALTMAKPLASVILFDGGRLQGLLNEAKASYHETVASYRQTVLNAFQEVEDNLAAIHWLDKEKQSQTLGTAAALRALDQAKKRYFGGITNYLDVVVNENIALAAELALVDIKTRRQLASVQLIKALGGGWSCGNQCAKTCQLPKVPEFSPG